MGACSAKLPEDGFQNRKKKYLESASQADLATPLTFRVLLGNFKGRNFPIVTISFFTDLLTVVG